jgi:sortase A
VTQADPIASTVAAGEVAEPGRSVIAVWAETLLRATNQAGRSGAGRIGGRLAPPKSESLPPTPIMQTVSRACYTLAGVLIAWGLVLLVITPLTAATAQSRLFDEVQLSLAEGSTPTGPIDAQGRIVEAGTPLGALSVQAVGLRNVVFVQGTTSAQTAKAIGHRRDTVLPCQVGASVLYARRAAYGGLRLGGSLLQLRPGDTLNFTTGQGSCTYKVIDTRDVGDVVPPIKPGTGRLTLTTAAGTPFFPREVTRIDADLVGDAFPAAGGLVPTSALDPSELPLGSGAGPARLMGLVLLLQGLIALSLGAMWCLRRWGGWWTWIGFGPLIAALFVMAADTVNLAFLPNLL